VFVVYAPDGRIISTRDDRGDAEAELRVWQSRHRDD
jgi:hypothetical protein